MNTKKISQLTGICFSACSKWAKENGVNQIKVKGIMAYDWTEKDLERFNNRPKRILFLPLKQKASAIKSADAETFTQGTF